MQSKNLALRLRRTLPISLVAVPLLTASTAAQETAQEPMSPLQRVEKIFGAMDGDGDGLVAPREAVSHKIRGKDFAAFDHDVDRQWSKDEFITYYRQLLKRANKRVPIELDEEVQRITIARAEAQAQAQAEAQAKAEAEAEAAAERKKARASAPVEPSGARVLPEGGAQKRPDTRGTRSEPETRRPQGERTARPEEDAAPATTAPATTEPATTGPATTEPETTEPAPTGPGAAGRAAKAQREKATAALQRAQASLGNLVAAGVVSAEDARSIYFQLLERARQAQPGADPAPGSHAETPAPSTAEELDRLWTARVLLERAQERIKGAVSQGSLDSEGGRELLELIEQRVRDFPAASEEEFGPQPVRDQSGDVSAPPADTVEEPTVRAQHQDATEALENRASAADASREQLQRAQAALDERARNATDQDAADQDAASQDAAKRTPAAKPAAKSKLRPGAQKGARSPESKPAARESERRAGDQAPAKRQRTGAAPADEPGSRGAARKRGQQQNTGSKPPRKQREQPRKPRGQNPPKSDDKARDGQ